jgi:hypothetical protein
MPNTIANDTVDQLLHHAHLVATTHDSMRLTQATRGKGVRPLTRRAPRGCTGRHRALLLAGSARNQMSLDTRALAAIELLTARTQRRAMVLLSIVPLMGLSTLSVSLPLTLAAAVLLCTTLLLPAPGGGGPDLYREPNRIPLSNRPDQRRNNPGPGAGCSLGVIVRNAQPTLNRAAQAAGQLAARHRNDRHAR